MLDVNLCVGHFLLEPRPFRPRMSHSRFFLGNYCCLFMPELGSISEIGTVVRLMMIESTNKVWTVKAQYGGKTILYDEETEKLQYRHEEPL